MLGYVGSGQFINASKFPQSSGCVCNALRPDVRIDNTR